tara:strand:+ start:6400 stop:7506 length:1107 start_codon:yes stop_codon:yes gene_type:complete
MISNSLVSKSISTTILDEKLHVATEITPQILSDYSSAQSIIEEEALFSIQPEKNAISENPIIFFTPKIRESDNYKKKVLSLVSELSTEISKGTIFFNCTPLGYGQNSELVEIIERSSGLNSETDFIYSYLPLEPRTTKSITFGTHNLDNKKTVQTLAKNANIKFTDTYDLELSEILHLEKLTSLYSPIISKTESLKKIKDYDKRKTLKHENYYVDDLTNHVSDIRCFNSSLDSGDPSLYMMSGISRSIDSFTRYFIDELKSFMKHNSLKASKTEIYLCWSIDKSEIRGDKSIMHEYIIDKIYDVVGNINDINEFSTVKNGQASYYLPTSDKKQLLILCSKTDEKILKTFKRNLGDNMFLIHANTLCNR